MTAETFQERYQERLAVYMRFHPREEAERMVADEMRYWRSQYDKAGNLRLEVKMAWEERNQKANEDER